MEHGLMNIYTVYKCIMCVYYINKPASCLFIIFNFSCKEKSVFFGCFSIINNFLVGTHLACRGSVLESEIGSAQHVGTAWY